MLLNKNPKKPQMKLSQFSNHKFKFCLIFLSSFFLSLGQENSIDENLFTKIDSLYREDQFYLGITYNLLKNAPVGFSNDKFSAGFSGGFLRDMPLNKNRNIAFASGLGLTFNNYSQNIGIIDSGQTLVYKVLDGSVAYSQNKFSLLFLDLPIEFRWRTSTFENHQFWRIHGGFKCSYLFFDRSVFRSPETDSVIIGNSDFNKWQYGTYLSVGYSGINLYLYYGLNSVFKSAQIDGKNIAMKPFNIGLIFYIL